MCYFISTIRVKASSRKLVCFQINGEEFDCSGTPIHILKYLTIQTRTVVRRCSVKKMFLKFSQYSQEYTSLGVSNKVAGPKVNFIKKRLQYKCFPVNIGKFLRTPFLQNTSGGCFSSELTHVRLCYTHIETSRLICIANQLTSLYMSSILT